MADFDIDISEIAEEDSFAVQGGVRNYVADEGIATVPRRWKSRPGQPETQLAYITDEEAALLKKENIHRKDNPEDMGTVNVGPDGVPSYDDSGFTDYAGFPDDAADNLADVLGTGETAAAPLPPQLGGPSTAATAAAHNLSIKQAARDEAAALRSVSRMRTAPEREDPNWLQRQWASFFPPITPFGSHSGDFGIPDNIDYRDFDFGRDVGFPMGLTGIPLMMYRYNRYLQRKNPHLERAEAMKGQDPTKFEYGPSWVYGQPKPKAKDYGDGGPDALLKKRLPVGAVPSAVATPQGIVSGDPIFGGRTKTFTGFDPNAHTAGARGAFQYFNNPVVAQRGGLLDAAEIQRFQAGGKPKPDPRLPSTNFFSKVFTPVTDVFRTEEEINEEDRWSDNPFDQTPRESEWLSGKKDPEPNIRAWGDLGYSLIDLPVSIGEALVKAPGAIASNLSRVFTSDPVVGPDYSSLDPAQETQMRNTAAQMARFLGTTPSHYDTGLADVQYDEDLGYVTLDGTAIDTTAAFDRGGAIRASDLAGDYGTMNRMISDPRGIASLGRGGDTMLVHMRPDEVAAMSRDGRTTVNPHTGLPERFLGATLGGLAGSWLGPWGVGIGSGLGQFAQQKLMGRRTGDALQQGLYTGALAGLGSYGLGKYAGAGGGDPNWIQSMLSPEAVRTKTAGGAFTYAPGAMDPAKFGLPGKMVYPLTAGLAGMGGSMLGEMAAPPLAPPEEEPITQPQAIARAKRSRYLRGDPRTYGSGAEQYMFDRNKGIFDYTFAQEGGLMEAAEEEELVETSPDGVEMAYLQEDAEVMTPPGIPGMEEGMDIVVKEAVRAIRGEHPEPERAIAEYIEVYGEEDFAALREMVTQDQALEGMGEAPVEVAEASETVEEMPLMAARGGMLNGPGKGRDDQIPVLASDGEYIVAADVVSGLGDGSTKAGAQTLDAMADRVRQMRTGTEKQPEILPEEMALPA